MSEPLPCSGRTDLFFSVRPADVEAARALCTACARREACLQEALAYRPAYGERCGVWGGTTPAERRGMRRELPETG